MSLISLKKNLTYYFLISVSQVLIPIFSIPYISRILSPDGVGRVSFIDSYAYYFVTIAEFGITVYGSRAVARLIHDREALRKLISELILLHVFSSLLTIVLYGIATYFIFDHIGDIRLIIFSMVFLLFNSLACEWYFLGTEQFRYITIRSFFIRLMALLSIFLIIRKPADYYLYYGIISLASVMVILSNIVKLHKEQQLSFRDINWKRHIRYIWVTYLVSLFYSINLYIDNVLLGLMATAYSVGVYAFAMKIVRVSGTLLSDSQLVFFPRVVSFIRDNKMEELQNALLRSVQLIIVFSIPLMAGTFLLSNELVSGLLGKGFIESASALRVLVIFLFLRSYNLFLSKQVLVSYDREKLYLRSLIAGSVIFVTMMLLLAPKFTFMGACYAIIIAELATLVVNLYYVKKTSPMLVIFDWLSFGQSVLASLIFIPVIYLTRHFVSDQWIILLLCVPACCVFYFTLQTYIFRNHFMVSLKNSFFRYIFKPSL